MRRGSSLTFLSTPVRPPMELGRNCKGTKWSSSHWIGRGWNHRWSVRKQCGTFVRDWRQGLADRISRGDNKLAPERIRWARGSHLHIIQRVSGGKEQRPTLLSNTQSKSLRFRRPVIKGIVHDDAWYLPENPEFDYDCLINICGSMMCFQIPGKHHEFRGRRIL